MRAIANGTVVNGPLSFDISQNSHFHADTFTAEFAIGGDSQFGIAFWGSQVELDLDIQASIDNGQTWTSLIYGQVDRIQIHQDHQVCSVTGRDLSARLIDAKTQMAYQNQTSSQVATSLANAAGLAADVQDTGTLIGRYYSQDHDHVTSNQFTRTTTEWDLLVYLAQREQFNVWVTGTTLHFKSGPQLGDDPWMVVWSETTPFQSNVMTLTLERSLTLAKDVTVAVRSWNSRHGKGFTKYSPGPPKSGSTAQQYYYVFPNMTEDEAQKKATALREDITRHERLVSFTAPADLTLTAQNMVQLTGTGSSWDQAYYVDHVSRRMTFDGAFVMDVRCKNHSPQSDAIGP